VWEEVSRTWGSNYTYLTGGELGTALGADTEIPFIPVSSESRRVYSLGVIGMDWKMKWYVAIMFGTDRGSKRWMKAAQRAAAYLHVPTPPPSEEGEEALFDAAQAAMNAEAAAAEATALNNKAILAAAAPEVVAAWAIEAEAWAELEQAKSEQADNVAAAECRWKAARAAMRAAADAAGVADLAKAAMMSEAKAAELAEAAKYLFLLKI